MFRFGHYEVLENSDGSPVELGRGAMGITYKALDTSLHRTVALKVINPDSLTGADAEQRFLREARAAAQLKHPNVASIFHLGEEGGAHFYAMEFIEGETLEALMERSGPLPCGFALDVAGQVAEALVAAHAANLIHRDIKPANLMLVQDPTGKIMVKVIDFGLAKNAGPHGGGHGPHEATITMGGFVGTPHFASPEQLEEKELDIRSDIYSLGATLWHMLTGRTLFAGSLVRVMIAQISEAPPFDHLAAPAELLALLRSMLAKEPAERPQTPPALLAQIREAASAVDPDFVCGTSGLDGENWTGFTLQELLRVRRVLPLEEVLVIVKSLAEALDPVGPRAAESVDLRIHAIAIDFAKPPTASPHDSMLQAIAQWPAFTIKFRNIERTDMATTDEGDAERTLLQAPEPLPAGGYIQRLGSIAYELLGGKSRTIAADGAASYAPLAALSEEGNAVLRKALCEPAPRNFKTGMMFHDAFAKCPKGAVQGAMPPVVAASPTLAGGIESPPPFPASAEALSAGAEVRRKKFSFFKFAFVLLLLGGSGLAGVFWLRHGTADFIPALKRKYETLVGNSAPSTKQSLAQSNTHPATSVATPVSKTPAPSTPARVTPAPTPELDRSQRLKLALGEISEFEAANDWPNALASTVKIAKNFPEYDKAISQIDEMVVKLRDQGIFRRDFREYANSIVEASDLGSVQAMIVNGERFRKHQPDKSLALFRAAADKGSPQAMTETGLMYLHGEGVIQDLKEAEKWFKKASDAKDPSGTFVLAESYLTGRVVKQDTLKGVQLLQDAATHNSGDAKNLLGKMYLSGLDGFPMNKGTAMELFREAKDLNCSEAYYNLGMINLSSHTLSLNPARAAFLFKHGAELGNSLCMFEYAKCLDEGSGVLINKEESAAWYAKAIDPLKKESAEGKRASVTALAMCLEGGKGIQANYQAAAGHYARAAAMGDPVAAKWCIDHRIDVKPLPPVQPNANGNPYRPPNYGNNTGASSPGPSPGAGVKPK